MRSSAWRPISSPLWRRAPFPCCTTRVTRQQEDRVYERLENCQYTNVRGFRRSNWCCGQANGPGCNSIDCDTLAPCCCAPEGSRSSSHVLVPCTDGLYDPSLLASAAPRCPGVLCVHHPHTLTTGSVLRFESCRATNRWYTNKRP